ncbi:MAG TPA: TonB-dependent receptor, partial [Nonomuraea sp.]|nr:TonB-dependent receptor [Nonomuraea sp.]
MGQFGRALLLVVLLGGIGAGELAAQGVTSAALYGIVLGPDSTPVADAVVTVTNTADGGRWRTTTPAGGRYAFEYLSVGGPYTVEARAIGFRPAGESGILLSLGERRRADIAMAPMVAQLAELVVQAADPRLNGSRTGPGQTFTGAEAAALPLAQRVFSQLVLLSPQAVVSRDTGISIAGQPDRLNGLQIDGASVTDLGGIHGISGFGTPGAASRIRVLPLEAIRELQVLVAPFDVRYSQFAGGLVNAVTRSGTNHWEASVSSYFQNQALTGKDSAGVRAEEFSTKELSVTLGGPIIRDRAAFFVHAGLQRFVGARGLSLGPDTTGGADSLGIGIRRSDLERFRQILHETWQVEDPGSIGPGTPHNPSGNLLAKVTIWPALNQRVELSHNHSEGTSSGFFDVYHLSSQRKTEPATFNDTRAAWTAGSAQLTNELTLARVAAAQRCFTGAAFPEINVDVGLPDDTRPLTAGAVNGCPERFARQTTWELTDNATWTIGAHRLTVGTHLENIQLDGSRRVLIPAGRWYFRSFDSLETGQPFRYTHDFPAPSRPSGPVSNYTVQQAGLYAQDQWMPWPGFVLTAGLRADVPHLPKAPPQNPVLLATRGINTAVTPSGHILWSPRLGFNYDVGNRGTTFVRGGVGLFSGRPMFLYFSNVFETTGLTWLRAECRGSDVPTFTADPAQQPTSCLSATLPIPPEVNYFDPSFRFPRNLRLSLGSDMRLPWGMVGTVDLLYIRGVNQFDITAVNLHAPTAEAGEGGRPFYGTFDESGSPIPNKIDTTFDIIAQIRNGSGDHSISVSGQLMKRFAGGTDISLAYTYTDARDRISPDCFNVTCNLDFTPLDGTIDHRALTPSNFSVRHKITLGVVMQAPLHFQLGVFYNGYSGGPFSYIIDGDANADGLQLVGIGNDIVYVPKDSADITLTNPDDWPMLDSLIRSQRCLSAQRGQL